MKRLPLLLSLLIALPLVADEKEGKSFPDPARFEKAIEQFEAMDAEAFPPEGAVLFYGSSSIRMWHEQLPAIFAPLEVIPRGFGGSTMHDALHFAERVVLPYKPRAIVLYEGDNDTNMGVAPEKILASFEAFVAKVHAELPECRIYVLAIKPSPARWGIWHDVVAPTNAELRERCEAHPLLRYVDIAAPMLLPGGGVDPSIFVEDQVHMNRAGYERWRDVLRPILFQDLL